MRRTTGGLVGLVLVVIAAFGGGLPTATAAGAATTIVVGIVADEGPAPVVGRKVWFAASLRAGDSPLDGATLILMARPYGATEFTEVGRATTDSDGSASTSVRLDRSSMMRWSFAGDAEHDPATSAGFLRTMGSKVSAQTRAKTRARGQAVVVRGRSYPAKPGYRVSLWRGSVPCFCAGGPSTRVAVSRIRPDGTFRLVARFPRSGTKRLYVQVNPGGGTTTGYSRYLRVRVR